VIQARTAAAFRRATDPSFVEAVAGPMVAAAVALWVVIPTLAPTVASWDTAEFQTVGPVMGTAHPTGYPAYVILGWIASVLFQPFGEPAFRMNLLQAVLAAVAVGATTALVGILTGRRLVALATGLVLLVMPTVSQVSVSLPVPGTIVTTPVFMRLATHADPHMFHVALVAILFGLLVIWDRRIHEAEASERGRADRWLIAAAVVYGVAVANHSLALLLPPAIGLFVLLTDWRIVRRWRSILACVAALAGTIAILFAELPIRAAMHAPLVYGHPDSVGGFTYVVLAEQFRGSLIDPLGDLGEKAAAIVDLMSGWLGLLVYPSILGLGTSLVRRPRYVVLSGLTLLITAFFSVSYANADIERYFLVPVMIAFTWVGLGVADLIYGAELLVGRFGPGAEGRPLPGRVAAVVLTAEIVAAVALVVPVPGALPARAEPESAFYPGGVSESGQTDMETWMYQVLAPADQGGLPRDSVVVSWWSASTTLWYGQRVLGLRPDIYIVDDRTRLDDDLGSVQDVFDRFLGKRPVFTIRLDGGADGMAALGTQFDIQPYTLGDGSTINEVVGRKGSQ
jgi:hypothetical protein